MAINADNLRKTMRQWGSGVTVVTVIYEGKRAGVTASSFTSVSLEPPLVLVCLQNHIETYKLIEQAGQFGISILSSEQADLSKQFAGFVPLPEGADRFHEVNLFTATTGAPLLADAAAWMDCKLTAIHEAGPTSRIIVGEVLATGQQEGKLPLIYHNRQYYDITPQGLS